jgi:hypothetical protein
MLRSSKKYCYHRHCQAPHKRNAAGLVRGIEHADVGSPTGFVISIRRSQVNRTIASAGSLADGDALRLSPQRLTATTIDTRCGIGAQQRHHQRIEKTLSMLLAVALEGADLDCLRVSRVCG